MKVEVTQSCSGCAYRSLIFFPLLANGYLNDINLLLLCCGQVARKGPKVVWPSRCVANKTRGMPDIKFTRRS